MLVDLPSNWQSMRDPITAILAGPGYVPVHWAKGVYETHFNFEHDIRSLVTEKYPTGIRSAYGVCDYWQQIIAHEPGITSNPEPYIISLTRIRKQVQPESGGWRWHKWGQYIGEKTPTTEYLYDEPEIDEVFVYHVYEVNV